MNPVRTFALVVPCVLVLAGHRRPGHCPSSAAHPIRAASSAFEPCVAGRV